MENKSEFSLHWATAVGALGDTAANHLPFRSVDTRLAAGDPAGQVSTQATPVVVLRDLSLADSLPIVALVVMELL